MVLIKGIVWHSIACGSDPNQSNLLMLLHLHEFKLYVSPGEAGHRFGPELETRHNNFGAWPCVFAFYRMEIYCSCSGQSQAVCCYTLSMHLKFDCHSECCLSVVLIGGWVTYRLVSLCAAGM